MNNDFKEKIKENANGADMAMYDQTMDNAKELCGDEVEHKPRRSKFKPETYQFISVNKGASFMEVLTEMRVRSIEISDFMNCVENSYEEKLHTIDEYFAAIAHEMADECPGLLSKFNIHTMFSVSANNLFARLENGIAFGFNITYKVYNGVAKPEFTVGTITLYEDKEELREELLSNGWRREERKGRNR